MNIKKIITIALILAIFLPLASLASDNVATDQVATSSDVFFRAEVNAIIKQETNKLIDNHPVEQQNLRLKGIDGPMAGKQFFFNGIGDYDAVTKNIYKKGDKVIVVESKDAVGNKTYFITDFVRTDSLLWLIALFMAVLIIVGRSKGVKSLISLVFTFLVIVKFIVPQILLGTNPLLVTVIGSLIILVFIIYLTEGLNHQSHLAVASMIISLLLTIILSWIFVGWSRLSGMSSEEVGFMATIGKTAINFKGLLLAGIIIGSLGVLDDVVISQITAVDELNKANPNQKRKELFVGAYNIGLSHISSMTNTLFLAYAGVAMPLLILFASGQSAFSGWMSIINNENIAEEIVRTITGSIGLILAVPISTILSVWWTKRKK